MSYRTRPHGKKIEGGRLRESCRNSLTIHKEKTNESND